jgi:hypothetical protein
MNQHLTISEIHKKRQRSRVTPEDILFDWLRRFGRALRSIFNIQRCVYGDPSSIVTEHRL